MKSTYLYFNDFPLFFTVFINIHEYAYNANMITCIFDPGIKSLCLSFNFVLHSGGPNEQFGSHEKLS